jgi:proline utilization trans-activator
LDRLDLTYKLSIDDDHVWLCRLFAVFALGELYSQDAKSDVEGEIPGTGYFRTAMSLFQDLYEEPTISYIETLLVIVSNSSIPKLPIEAFRTFHYSLR